MMRRTLTSIRTSAHQSLRDIALGIGFAVTVIVLAGISLGFGTFGLFQYFRGAYGSTAAALIISAIYAAVSMLIFITWRMRTRAHDFPASTAQGNASTSNQLLDSLCAETNKAIQNPIASLMQAGGKLTSLQLVTLALVSGFISVQKSGSRPPNK